MPYFQQRDEAKDGQSNDGRTQEHPVVVGAVLPVLRDPIRWTGAMQGVRRLQGRGRGAGSDWSFRGKF